MKSNTKRDKIMFFFHTIIVVLFLSQSACILFAQEQTIELKQQVVETAKSNAPKYLKTDSLESKFQAELPKNLDRAINGKMTLPLDTRMFEWTMAGGFTVETELNTAVSVFWNGELISRKKLTDNALGFYQKSGLTFEITEQSMSLKNSFEIMQVFERFWTQIKNTLKVYKYEFTDSKKKNAVLWTIIIREETEKSTSYGLVLLGPGMSKPLEISASYKNLLIDNITEHAPADSFGVDAGIWNEQYSIDGKSYTDVLVSLSPGGADNGLLVVLRYQEQEYLGNGIFYYLETASK